MPEKPLTPAQILERLGPPTWSDAEVRGLLAWALDTLCRTHRIIATEAQIFQMTDIAMEKSRRAADAIRAEAMAAGKRS